MPLYLDLHEVDIDTFSIENAYEAHFQDLTIQKKHGVTYHKYWISIDDKMSFCLMEGPNKQACKNVHLESHGLTACNIIEITDKEFNLYLGMGDKDQHDLARTPKGELDVGFRTLVQTDVLAFSENYEDFLIPLKEKLNQNFGTSVHEPERSFTASFIYPADAISYVKEIQNALSGDKRLPETKIAIVTGKPVDKKGSIPFEKARVQLNDLITFGRSFTLNMDTATKTLLGRAGCTDSIPENTVFFGDTDFKFLRKLSTAILGGLSDHTFRTANLSSALGLSKAHAYRKLKEKTGLAPNQLINDLRLRKAMDIISKGELSVAEVAYATGFNSPTYFTRAFRKKFKMLPSEFAKAYIA